MWFRKKEPDKKQNFSESPSLPELPELPQNIEIPSLPIPITETKNSLPALPSFPSSETADRISQEVTKSSFERQPKPYTRELSPSGQVAWTPEKKDMRIKEVERKRVVEVSPRLNDKAEPVFVRIDKFQNAVGNFNEIKKQLSEIENYLSDIRDVRAKEEHELGNWEKEILELKGKLEIIEKTIFSKLE